MGLFQSTLPVRGATPAKDVRPPKKEFQSTLPVRGATAGRGANPAGRGNFNPRSP